MRKISSKGFFRAVLLTTISLLLLIALTVLIIDPMMHYHKPIDGLAYVMKDEFYLNPGIAKQYDYDAVIVGDSSCQNFLTSIIKEKWGYETVKLTNQGAPYSEADEILNYAFSQNDGIKAVFRAVDPLMLACDPYMKRYPKRDYYLMDDNIFNDVYYIFNLDMFKKCFSILKDTKDGKTTWNMDMYSNWEDFRVFGSEQMLKSSLVSEPTVDYSDKEQAYLWAKENVEKNVCETIEKHPDVIFYLFIPPYHVAYYKTLMNNETFESEFEVQRIAIEILLSYDNVKLFSFSNDYDITSDWSNYCDIVHSKQDVNSRILYNMFDDNFRLTKENYLDYLKEIQDYYRNYDYDSLVKE